MAFPTHADDVAIGAGIHRTSTAWKLAERLQERGDAIEGRIVVLGETGIAAAASAANISWLAPATRLKTWSWATTKKLLDPFRFGRFAKGELRPVSNSPYPWS